MRAAPPMDPRRAERPVDYYDANRADVLPLIPVAARTFLEVGAARGGFGPLLRVSRNVERLVAVEPANLDGEFAAYDAVITAAFPVHHPEFATAFDCILLNDVIEHMADPWACLEYASTLLTPGGSLVVSVPNVFNVATLVDLVVRGDWAYRSSGVLDVDHLRFFTRRSAERMLQACGLSVVDYRPLDPLPLPARRATTRLLRWRAVGFRRMGFRATEATSQPH